MEEHQSLQRVIFVQPYEVEVTVSDKLNAKGNSQPEIKVKISRKLESGAEIVNIIGRDISSAIDKVKSAMKSLSEIS